MRVLEPGRALAPGPFVASHREGRADRGAGGRGSPARRACRTSGDAFLCVPPWLGGED